ncbi:MAG: M48 family peptidase [Gammaproteobacteria bacterium]|nr:MAG: M48 family peptidase [Gammaproteobacteria bacterium]
MNTFTVIFIIILACGFLLQYYLVLRHISHIDKHRQQAPAEFREKITPAEHAKAAAYNIAKARTGLVDLSIEAALLLVWTLGGGLQWLADFWTAFGLNQIATGALFMLSFTLISAALGLPLSIYHTFYLEQRFGFNKTTPGTFVLDLLKQCLLLFVIGLPFLWVVLWLMAAAGALWWLYVWGVWFAFSLFMMWAWPAFIAPLFNKFKPLEREDLRARIESLLQRNGFASRGIFVMDGSRRSSHGNAYFTGLGANKRIVFFDTLLKGLTDAETEAVLAHELGHFKRHHIKKRIALSAGLSLLGLALLGWLMQMPWYYAGLGVITQTPYMALTLFMLVAPLFSFFLQPAFSWLSRAHEYEADRFAAAQTAAEDLVQALVKLYRENASTLTPDPLYSAFHDSHPPAPLRIARLREVNPFPSPAGLC